MTRKTTSLLYTLPNIVGGIGVSLFYFLGDAPMEVLGIASIWFIYGIVDLVKTARK